MCSGNGCLTILSPRPSHLGCGLAAGSLPTDSDGEHKACNDKDGHGDGHHSQVNLPSDPYSTGSGIDSPLNFRHVSPGDRRPLLGRGGSGDRAERRAEEPPRGDAGDRRGDYVQERPRRCAGERDRRGGWTLIPGTVSGKGTRGDSLPDATGSAACPDCGRFGVAASPVEMYSLRSGPNFSLPPLLNKAPGIFSIITFSEIILFLFSVIAKTLLYNFPEDS